MTLDQKKVRANERIRSPQVRLIGAAGEQIGITTVQDALRKAQEVNLDLVEVSATSVPPVCRIMDLGKYLYALEKKEKESRKKQKVIDVKEIKMTTKIEDHDYQTKLRNARKFIERGDKVKLTVFFRGREIVYVDKGNQLIARFVQDLSDIAMIERNVGLEGKMIQVYLMKINPVTKKKETPDVSAGSAGPTKTE
ncbi:MAG TPA: translation initiation factor IF-3 [Candidatus Omnitrophota bacterium]|nr:translation initiation factor IF-3 [Candidatus Omnitrophota bacterium]